MILLNTKRNYAMGIACPFTGWTAQGTEVRLLARNRFLQQCMWPVTEAYMATYSMWTAYGAQ
jgi:hypothetical protein